MKRTWRIDGLDCANCAAKVEHAVGKINGVAEARLDFMNSKLTVTTGQDMEPSFWHSVERKAIETEPDITMTCNETGGTASVRTLRAQQGDASSVHHDDHEHDHHHDHDHHGGACGCGHVHGEDDSLECGCERKVASLGNAGHPAGCTCPLCSGEKCAVQVCVREGNTWLNADLARIVTALVMFIVGKIISGIAGDVLAIAAYLLAGYDVLWRAIKNILKGKIFDENFLMSVATIGAAIIGDYAEAAAVMIFYQTGEYFQDAAVRRSRKSISELMDIRPQTATVVRNGIASVVDPTTIQVGEIIRLLPGDRVPLDAVVTSGSSFIDTMALTGEPVPRKAEIGDELISGCVNTSAMLEAKVERRYEDSTVSRILELVEDSSGRKAPSEQFITKFARYYTPAVVVSAVLLAILPPLLGFGQFSEWVYRALVFLVISCPCALVISIPLSYFGGIGGSARKGILVKGGNYLQALAKVDTFVFDKTGTITEGVFNVQHVQLYDDGYDEQTLLAYASAAERMSNHPVAKAIVAASKAKPLDATSAEEFAGKGIKALVGSHTVLAGNLKLLSQERIPAPAPSNEIGTVVFVAIDGTLAGKIVVADKIKDSARQAISRLKRLGVVRTVMLTGDSNSNATQVAREVGIDEVHASLLPQMKVDELEKVIAAGNGTLAYVGDGINDAPVLARADIGIAMGAMGSDAAIEAADVVIMTDDLDRAADAMLIARKTNRIVMQNIVFALGVKAVVLLLGALGIAGMWMAVFADVGVAVIAIINAMRALRVRRMA